MGQFNFEAGNCVARLSKTRYHRLPVELERDVSREGREGGEGAGARLNISSKTRHHRLPVISRPTAAQVKLPSSRPSRDPQKPLHHRLPVVCLLI